MSAPVKLAGKAATLLQARRRAARFRAGLDIAPRGDLVTVGDLNYGGYIVPGSLLGTGSRCLHAGTGTDVSFDVLMIARFGCEVHAVDPVPAAAEYVRAATAHEPRFSFSPVALWDRDETLTFHAPRVAGYISHSAVDMHGTDVAFEAPARSTASLMQEWGWDVIDLLKVSAEGSEYRILHHVLEQDLAVKAICVEFAQPAPAERAEQSIDALRAAGWSLVGAGVTPWNWKLTFVSGNAAR